MASAKLLLLALRMQQRAVASGRRKRGRVSRVRGMCIVGEVWGVGVVVGCGWSIGSRLACRIVISEVRTEDREERCRGSV